jgi:hypothetical protein
MSNIEELPVNFNNGLMPKIYEHKGNLDHVMVDNDIKLTPGKTVHCADNILSGVLEETYLSKYFFSDDNIMNIQKIIRYEFFKEKSTIIDYQSNTMLLTIMRGIFLKYSNSAARSLDEIREQIQKLNNMVVQYSLSKIYSNYDMHNKYLKDINSMPSLMELPKSNTRKNYTHDLSERNNMNVEQVIF